MPDSRLDSFARADHTSPETDEEAPFEMTNLRATVTGLPFVVFVSQQAGARHGPRIKISPLPRYNPSEAITVTLEHPPRPLGDIGGSDLKLVQQWIELNRVVIEGYWSGDIEYTDEMVSQIKPV